MGPGYKIWRPRIPLLLRLCLLQFDNLPKYCYQLKPRCSNTTIYGRVFIFKLQHRAAFSYYLVLSWCLVTKWLWEHSLSHIILTWILTHYQKILLWWSEWYDKSHTAISSIPSGCSLSQLEGETYLSESLLLCSVARHD